MLGFHSIRPDIESGRPLRNTATAYSAPTLRARCEAPSPASCSDHSLYLFQLAGALSTGQYKWAVSKQRKRPQTANRLEGVICPRGVEYGVSVCSGLWTRHYRQLMFCNRPFFQLSIAPIPSVSFIDLYREQRLAKICKSVVLQKVFRLRETTPCQGKRGNRSFRFPQMEAASSYSAADGCSAKRAVRSSVR